MFIGHFAAALAAKPAAPRTSLGWLFAACQLSDLLWPLLLLAGIESARVAPGHTAFTPLAFDYYPWSHSLLTVTAWGLAFAGAYRLRGGSGRGAAAIALLVLSHWALDWVTHRPDLPLAPGGGPHTGLGLWHSVPATLAVEGLLFGAGVWLYSRATAARDRIGRVAFISLVASLALIYLANAFGPPPPDITAVALAALAIWLLVLWAGWADRHRTAAPRA